MKEKRTPAGQRSCPFSTTRLTCAPKRDNPFNATKSSSSSSSLKQSEVLSISLYGGGVGDGDSTLANRHTLDRIHSLKPASVFPIYTL